MKKMIFAVLALSVASVFSWAESSPFKSDSPKEYVVADGDTLWGISEKFLDAPWLWPEIWHANPEIDNPHLIFPGDVVRMVYIDGKPRLTVDRTVRLVPSGDAKLEPTIRVLPIEAAIPAISLDKIASYLSRSRIVMPEDVEGVPYIVAGPDKRLIVAIGDIGYARGDFPDDIYNFSVFRQGETFVDETGEEDELLGVHAVGVGAVSVDKVQGDIARVLVTRSDEELRAGDILLPSAERAVDSIFYPSAADFPIEAEIIAVEGGVSKIGTMDVAIINRGRRDGVQVGNVFEGFVRGETIQDRVSGDTIQLLDESAGLLMVFRTFEKLSFVIVVEAERPMAVGDILRNP
ncbi:LysM peptidoglycan-binding domain-containing protein [Gilvimarinus sp. SDUM040013]|uniref:LysM peptidoglycan-binding domain-containing protein n=1 Tax=Gilvimarinus gilvus TaxID=3058038 RepID=A0ABU4RW16_9GAMM|nr:LysM peptidoglycan-binding domain-containing protein [Gilvimarinus sp. SDUM040013]MDO3387720.1 LysM peptidoglycan-binding domain-containing protein [Gilvimarinus sp. SDUM040013]MDX6848839.1 LysM peptidoglycan-binding domain-containing protein [Gilvimarinus sp. SDUM040013]